MQTKNLIAKNKQFFERYAHLITSLSAVATIAQIIAAACEIGILYSLLNSALTDFLTGYWLNIVSTGAAILCAAMLQIGVKLIYPYAVRAILHKHFKNLELALTIGIFILTVALLTCSITLSFSGSKEIAESIVQKPIIKNHFRADSLKNIDVAQSNKLFSIDSMNTESKFSGKIAATNTDYLLRISQIERNGKSHATSLRAELKTVLSNLETEKATEMQGISTDRKKLVYQSDSRADSETIIVNADNLAAKSEADLKKSKYKGYIGYFAMFCYLFFLSIFTLNEIYKKGAEIKTKVKPSMRHLSASLISEFKETVLEKFDVWARTLIYAWHEKTPAQPLPTSLRALQEHEFDLLTDTVKIESEAVTTRVVKIPIKVHKLAASAENTDGKTDAPRQTIGFKTANNTSNDGKIYDGKSNDITASVMGNTDGKNYDGKTVIMNDGNSRICAYCNSRFIYSIHNQKFCSEDHRKAAWAQKTGKEFDLELKNKERSRKK